MTNTRNSMTPVSAIEIVRCIYDALEDGDTRTPAKYLRDDVEGFVSEFVPWGGYTKGLPAFIEAFRTMARYARLAFEPSELIDAGDNVIAIGRSVGIVHSTGRAFALRTVQVWRIEGEQVASVAYYHDRELASYLSAAAA